MFVILFDLDSVTFGLLLFGFRWLVSLYFDFDTHFLVVTYILCLVV